MKKPRYLEQIINDVCFKANKMAFIFGPSQTGKTTLAKQLLANRGTGNYYNWDETMFRRQWKKNPHINLPTLNYKKKPLIVLDELHKAKLWKNSLKKINHEIKDSCDILVTGSAHPNVYRKGSDSLMGRYYHFRLHPFSLAELLKNRYSLEPDDLIKRLFNGTPMKPIKSAEKMLQDLYQYGPFPEPLLAANQKTLNLWQRNRVEKIIREDLRDLSQLPELSQIEMLTSLLPERAAQPLSIQSLSEILEVAYTTVKRWLSYLNELYYFFNLKPYNKSLSRAIKKENKLYLWDWSEIENKGARFENLIASHLLKYCDYLTDNGTAEFDLRYLKNKEKYEIDFLLLRNKKVFLAVEAKFQDKTPCNSWAKFMPQLGCSYGVQVVMEPNVYKIYEYASYKILVISAASFLPYLI